MLIPLLVFFACVSAGVFAAARRLPDLEEGTVGGLAFLVVCCLLGAALGIVGLRIYTIANGLGSIKGSFRSEIVAQGLMDMLWEAGLVLGIATVVYLLATPVEPGGTAESDLDI